MMLTLDQLWDGAEQNFCEDLCAVAKAPPELASQPWLRIDERWKKKLREAKEKPE